MYISSVYEIQLKLMQQNYFLDPCVLLVLPNICAYYGIVFPRCSQSRAVEGALPTFQCFVDVSSLYIYPEKQRTVQCDASHTSCDYTVRLNSLHHAAMQQHF